MTNAGRICGMIATILSILGICIWIALAVMIGAAGVSSGR
jgi:hypothetical protein